MSTNPQHCCIVCMSCCMWYSIAYSRQCFVSFSPNVLFWYWQFMCWSVQGYDCCPVWLNKCHFDTRTKGSGRVSPRCTLTVAFLKIHLQGWDLQKLCLKSCISSSFLGLAAEISLPRWTRGAPSVSLCSAEGLRGYLNLIWSPSKLGFLVSRNITAYTTPRLRRNLSAVIN